jgi:hypothetical protein
MVLVSVNLPNINNLATLKAYFIFFYIYFKNIGKFSINPNFLDSILL